VDKKIIGPGKWPEGVGSAKARRQMRLMGFGHRVYRVEDPRAKHLRRLARSWAARWATRKQGADPSTRWPVVTEEKDIYPNVDLFLGRRLRGDGHRHRPVHADLRDEPRGGGLGGAVLEQHGNNRLIGRARSTRERRAPPTSRLPALTRPAAA